MSIYEVIEGQCATTTMDSSMFCTDIAAALPHCWTRDQALAEAQDCDRGTRNVICYNMMSACEFDALCLELIRSGKALGVFGMRFEQIEKLAILETLAKCEGNRAQAARKLGLSEKTIYNKINKYKSMLGKNNRES